MSLLADVDLDEVAGVSLHISLLTPLLTHRHKEEYLPLHEMPRYYLCEAAGGALVITDTPEKAIKFGVSRLIPLLTHVSPDEELLLFDEEPDEPFLNLSATSVPGGFAINIGRYSQLDARQEFLCNAVTTAVEFVKGVV